MKVWRIALSGAAAIAVLFTGPSGTTGPDPTSAK